MIEFIEKDIKSYYNYIISYLWGREKMEYVKWKHELYKRNSNQSYRDENYNVWNEKYTGWD